MTRFMAYSLAKPRAAMEDALSYPVSRTEIESILSRVVT